MLIDYKTTRKWLILIILLSLVIRIAYIFSTNYNSFQTPEVGGEYEPYVKSLLQREGYRSGHLYASRPCLFPLLWAGTWLIFPQTYLSVRLVLALIGSIISLLVYLIGKEMFNPKVGLLAALGSALYPPLIWYNTHLQTETLYIFFLLLFIWSLLKLFPAVSIQTESRKEQQSVCPWDNKLSIGTMFMSGIFLGLATLSRSVILGFLPLVILWLFIIQRRLGWRIYKPILFFILGCALVLTPWIIRNWLIFKAFVPLTTEGGETFYLGNNERALSTPVGFYRAGWVKELKSLGCEIEFNKITYQLGFDFIKENPGTFLKLMIDKFKRFWRPWPHSQFVGKKVTFIYFVTNLIAFPLILIGLFYAWRYRPHLQKKYLLIYLLVFYYTFIHMLYVAVIRYREPLMLLLFIFAAYGISRFIGKKKELN
ncbi:ArnT family glycosyltransferase [Planctomycetota bacterium]